MKTEINPTVKPIRMSEATERLMVEFLLKTAVPRILEERRREREKNE